MKNEKAHQITLVFVSIIAAAMYALPVMSIYLSGGESCTLIVRGYNLTEFSAWGCVPLFTPILLSAILFGYQTNVAKEVETLLVIVGHTVCYVHSLNAARDWLYEINITSITYYPNAFCFPVSILLVFLLAQMNERHERIECPDPNV